jgi:hypothetical protein
MNKTVWLPDVICRGPRQPAVNQGVIRIAGRPVAVGLWKINNLLPNLRAYATVYRKLRGSQEREEVSPVGYRAWAGGVIASPRGATGVAIQES